MNIRKPEDELEERGIVLRLATHRYDDGIDAAFLEVRIVDQRCFE